MNQIVAVAVRDSGEGAHAARHNDHAERDERAAADSRALIAGLIMARRHLLYFFKRVRRLVRERARRPTADDEVRLDARPLQHLQKAHAEDRAGRARQRDDQSGTLCLLHAFKPFLPTRLIMPLIRRKGDLLPAVRYCANRSATVKMPAHSDCRGGATKMTSPRAETVQTEAQVTEPAPAGKPLPP